MKDYKRIWNDLSENFADAGHYVGYEGEEDVIRKNGQVTAAFLRDVLHIQSTDRVLEIGCGIARIGREIAEYCGEWHGADISGNMIQHARSRTKDVSNIYLHELPDSTLDIFEEDYFDCVYSSIVFMHLDKVELFRYIEDAFRVLVPGGRAYFDTLNLLAPGAWQQFRDIVHNYPAGKRPGHVSQFCTPEEMQKYMEEAQYAAIDIGTDNDVIVTALGRKPSKLGSERSPSPLRMSVPAKSSVSENSENDSDNTAFHEWRLLNENLRTKDRYISTLEETLEEKNQHIAMLEKIVSNQEQLLSSPLVRIALRLRR